MQFWVQRPKPLRVTLIMPPLPPAHFPNHQPADASAGREGPAAAQARDCQSTIPALSEFAASSQAVMPVGQACRNVGDHHASCRDRPNDCYGPDRILH